MRNRTIYRDYGFVFAKEWGRAITECHRTSKPTAAMLSVGHQATRNGEKPLTCCGSIT